MTIEQDYNQAALAYALARERYANTFEMYNHLVDTVGPNLEHAFMIKIGTFECQVFKLELSVRRWRRRLELRQMALNRGEAPDLVTIETQVDVEFEVYLAELRDKEAELVKANGFVHGRFMSDAETTEIRAIYLDAVKKLHPDLNPDLPESAKPLWEKVAKAYKDKDWRQLEFLCQMVDGVVGKVRKFPQTEEGVAALRAEVERIESDCRGIHERIAALKREKPFAYEVLLEDPDGVQRRQDELRQTIAALEERIRGYEEEWKNGK